jgi:hypothetical protein
MVTPLQATFPVELYVTRPAATKKQAEEKDPPPSLWSNEELINYLGDLSGSSSISGMPAPGANDERRRNDALKLRLLMYAEQTISQSNKMRRYGAELPALARAGFGSDELPDVRRRAAAACLAHVLSLDKCAGRLSDALSHALPRAAKRPEATENPRKLHSKGSAAEITAQLAAASEVLSRRIHEFLYPQHHTVELIDLREPSLLESIRSLRALASDFQKAAALLR